MAKGINLDSMNSEVIMAELKKHRVDILGVILNHPDGRKWLDGQVAELKKKLSK